MRAVAIPPDTSDTSAITLCGASVRLSGKMVLPPLTLTLTERRIGIIGRNGSGKSTLLRLLAGLIAPASGTVRVGGIDPARDRRGTLARLGILFQNPDHQILFPSVLEELIFGLVQMGTPAPDAIAHAQSMLQLHGRADWANAPVATLSQGQRHWLCLMAVLLMEPDTILLDEPFAGLDLPTQIRLSRAFAALPQRLITITHDPETVHDHDRILWLDGGRIIADGPPEAVLPVFRTRMLQLGGLDADTDLSG
jgi:biotin transport system ATP-binding protein